MAEEALLPVHSAFPTSPPPPSEATMPHFPKDSGFAGSDPAKCHTLTVKNRRKRYLDSHPEYYSADLELADSLLYDRLIRRFQTPQEREAAARAKGLSGILQTDLTRSEERMDAISNPDSRSIMSYRLGPNGEILAEDCDDIPPNKEEAERLWRWEMGLRFLRGGDPDFDYTNVDDNEEYDDHSDKVDQYFEDEEPTWVGGNTTGEDANRNLQGETGIQDF